MSLLVVCEERGEIFHGTLLSTGQGRTIHPWPIQLSAANGELLPSFSSPHFTHDGGWPCTSPKPSTCFVCLSVPRCLPVLQSHHASQDHPSVLMIQLLLLGLLASQPSFSCHHHAPKSSFCILPPFPWPWSTAFITQCSSETFLCSLYYLSW